MPTAHTPPDPAELALLLQGVHFQHPTQKPIFAAYAAGDIGFETTVFRLVKEVLERAPQEAAQRALEAESRAEQNRIEAEMAANDKVDAPTYIIVPVDGKPTTEGGGGEPAASVPIVTTTSAPAEGEPIEPKAPALESLGGYDDTDEDTWGQGTSFGEDEDNSDFRGDD